MKETIGNLVTGSISEPKVDSRQIIFFFFICKLNWVTQHMNTLLGTEPRPQDHQTCTVIQWTIFLLQHVWLFPYTLSPRAEDCPRPCTCWETLPHWTNCPTPVHFVLFSLSFTYCWSSHIYSESDIHAKALCCVLEGRKRTWGHESRYNLSQPWGGIRIKAMSWHMPLILALERQKQVDLLSTRSVWTTEKPCVRLVVV